MTQLQDAKTVKVNGVDIAYRFDGPENGPVLLVANSLMANGSMWDWNLPAFTDRFRVLRYDTRGHGQSEVTPGPYTIAQLGADVPFMLNGGTAVGRGRGDEITPALSRGTYHWVIAVSSTGLSTPAVYGECDRLRTGLPIKQPQLNEELLQALLSADSERVGKALSNDLQAAACSLRPALRLVLDIGNEYGALGGIVSGSGPSVAFLVADEDQSLDLAVALTSSGVVGSVIRAQGPVQGARVVAHN